MDLRMSHRFLLAMGSLMLWAALPAAGQAPAKAAPGKPWTQGRTPDGQPDLQGIWTNPTITPFERPVELAGKAFLTDKEAAELEAQTAANSVDRPPAAGDTGTYNQFWFDRGTK